LLYAHLSPKVTEKTGEAVLKANDIICINNYNCFFNLSGVQYAGRSAHCYP